MKIDTSKIDGYETMSAEDKIKALEALELETPDVSGMVRKDLYDQVASELASKKKELREHMTEEEKAKAQREEEFERLRKENAELIRGRAVADNQAKLLALGYDPALAVETAEAMADGNLAKVFENQRQHQESLEKRIRADVLKATPRPNGDSAGSTAMTLEALKKMSDRERFDFQQSHPDEYRELYGGK